MKMNSSKISYYVLIAVINLFALGVIGISFLSSGSVYGERGEMISEPQHFFRHSLLALLSNLFFSVLILLTSFSFRRKMKWDNTKLLRIFTIEMVALAAVYLLTYLIVILRIPTPEL